jgi:hypothetical protein
MKGDFKPGDVVELKSGGLGHDCRRFNLRLFCRIPFNLFRPLWESVV